MLFLCLVCCSILVGFFLVGGCVCLFSDKISGAY